MSVEGAFGGGPPAVSAVGGPGRLVALRAVTDLLAVLDSAATPGQLRAAQGEARAALGTAYARGLIDATTLRLSLARVDAALPGPARAAPTPTPPPPPSPAPADTLELSSRPAATQPAPSPPASTQPGAPPRPTTGTAAPTATATTPAAAPGVPFDPDPLLALATLPLRTATSWSAQEVETWSRHVLPVAEEHVDAARGVALAAGARGEQQTAAATAHQLLSWSLATPVAPGLVPLHRHREELYAALEAGLPAVLAGALAQQAPTPPADRGPLGRLAGGVSPSLLLLACGALVLVLAGWLVS